MSTRRILPPSAPPGPGKHIAFDRATGDYAAYYDGQLLGYRPTHPEAQALAAPVTPRPPFALSPYFAPPLLKPSGRCTISPGSGRSFKIASL